MIEAICRSNIAYSEVKTEDDDALEDEVEKVKRLFPEVIAKRFSGYVLLSKIPILDLSAHYKFVRIPDSDKYKLEMDGQVVDYPTGYLSEKNLWIDPKWMTHETMRGLDPFNRPFIARKTFQKFVIHFSNCDDRGREIGKETKISFDCVVEVLHPGSKNGTEGRYAVKKGWKKEDWR